ncbi:MAG: helix-turn-helix domain-containing protein [Alphaproteobacteria bacterium]|jgi:transcriptional regulator with XRE-family HTH domain|nr:helix-turn-helix domain-containing protein [Alphaproteobacteria bacterium]
MAESGIVTGRQIRAARALLGWEQSDLAAAAGIAVRTLARWESVPGKPTGKVDTLYKIQEALSREGIEFLFGEAPGVRLHPVKKDKETNSEPA